MTDSAFCVSFSSKCKFDRHVTCAKTTPYNDWVNRGRPRCAVFTYTKKEQAANYTWYTYMPTDGLMELILQYKYFWIAALLRITVDDQAKSVHVTHAICEQYHNGDPEDEWDGHCWHGKLAFFRKQLAKLGTWPLDRAIRCMFGQSWTVVVGEGDEVVDKEIARRFRPLKRQLTPSDDLEPLWGSTVGMYDLMDEAHDFCERFKKSWRYNLIIFGQFEPIKSVESVESNHHA